VQNGYIAATITKNHAMPNEEAKNKNGIQGKASTSGILCISQSARAQHQPKRPKYVERMTLQMMLGTKLLAAA